MLESERVSRPRMLIAKYTSIMWKQQSTTDLYMLQYNNAMQHETSYHTIANTTRGLHVLQEVDQVHGPPVLVGNSSQIKFETSSRQETYLWIRVQCRRGAHALCTQWRGTYVFRVHDGFMIGSYGTLASIGSMVHHHHHHHHVMGDS